MTNSFHLKTLNDLRNLNHHKNKMWHLMDDKIYYRIILSHHMIIL